MNEHIARADAQRGVDEPVQMRLQRMHAAIGQKPGEMNRPAFFHRIDEHAIFVELEPVDRFADAQDVLIDDASRADVQVTDLRIPHLPGGKSDRGS